MIKFITKRYPLISGRYAIGVYLFILLNIFSIILDYLSLSILIPIFGIFNSNNPLDDTNLIIKFLFDLFGEFEKEKLFIYILISYIVILISKNILLLSINFFKIKFETKLRAHVSNNLFSKYLNEEYLFFNKNSSSDLTKNIIDQTSQYTSSITSRIEIFSESTLFLFLGSTLFFYNPSIFFSTFIILFILSFSYYLLTKKRIQNWGKERQKLLSLIFQNLQQSFLGIKEMKIYNSLNYNMFLFDDLITKETLINFKKLFIQRSNKIVFETIFVLSLGSSIYLIYLSKVGLVEYLTTLAIYAVFGYRILPSVITILNGLQNLKFVKFAVDSLNSFILSSKSDDFHITKKPNFINNIEFKNLSYTYDNSKKIILNKINFKIPKGSIVHLDGVTGSGKSTLIDILSGLYQQSDGQILYDSINIHKNNYINLREMVSIIPQNIFLSNDSIINNITLNNSIDINFKKIKKCLKISKCDDFVDLENYEKFKIGESGKYLSGGQRQRIAIARALYNLKQILIIDEGFSGIDVDIAEKILQNIKENFPNLTIIITSHNKFINKYTDYYIKV